MRLGIGAINAMEISPDGLYAAVSTSAGVYLYGAETLKQIWKAAVDRPFAELRWSPDGTMIAGRNRTVSYLREPYSVTIWDSSTGAVTTRFEHSTQIGGMAWSADSSRIAIGWGGVLDNSQSQVTIWDVATSQQHAILGIPAAPANPLSPASRIDALSWSPDGNLIAATTHHDMAQPSAPDVNAATVIIWDANQNSVNHFVVLESNEDFQYMTFSPDSRWLALYTGYIGCDAPRGDSRAFLIDTASGQVTQGNIVDAASNRSPPPVLSAAWSPDSSMLATGSGATALPGSIILRDVSSTSPPDVIPSATNVVSLSWSPDGAFVAAGERLNGHNTARVSVWDTKTGQASFNVYISGNYVESVIWLDNGRAILYQSELQLGIINAQTGEITIQVNALDGGGEIAKVGWSPDGQTIVGISSGSIPQGGNATLWNAADGRAESTSNYRKAFAIEHPDWRLNDAPPPKPYEIRADDRAGLLLLNNLDTGQPIISIPLDNALVAAVSPDGRLLATGDGEQISMCGDLFIGIDKNAIILWDIATQTILKRWVGHTGPVTSLAFSPDSKLLASGSIDGTIIIWPVEP